MNSLIAKQIFDERIKKFLFSSSSGERMSESMKEFLASRSL